MLLLSIKKKISKMQDYILNCIYEGKYPHIDNKCYYSKRDQQIIMEEDGKRIKTKRAIKILNYNFNFNIRVIFPIAQIIGNDDCMRDKRKFPLVIGEKNIYLGKTDNVLKSNFIHRSIEYDKVLCTKKDCKCYKRCADVPENCFRIIDVKPFYCRLLKFGLTSRIKKADSYEMLVIQIEMDNHKIWIDCNCIYRSNNGNYEQSQGNYLVQNNGYGQSQGYYGEQSQGNYFVQNNGYGQSQGYYDEQSQQYYGVANQCKYLGQRNGYSNRSR